MLGESGVVGRATANSSLPTATGHKQGDQAAKTKPPTGKLLADSGSEPGANASLLFKEPAAQMTQHQGWAHSRVGWTIPATHAQTNSLRIEHPIRTLTYRALVTRRSNQDLCLSCDNCLCLNHDPLPVMHQPVDQGRCQSVVHVKDFAPFPKGTIRGNHDRSDFIGWRQPGKTNRPRARQWADSPTYRGGE